MCTNQLSACGTLLCAFPVCLGGQVRSWAQRSRWQELDREVLLCLICAVNGDNV